MRNAWLSAALVAAFLLALGVHTSIVARTGFLLGDFRAFYCAAKVAAHRENPYYAEPLRACELSTGGKRFFKANPGVTIPAPLPGYALAAVVPFTALPFGVAALLWAALLLAASAAAIVLLAKFAAVAWQVALAAFALPLAVLSLPFGEIVPFALAFICLAGYFAWKGRWQIAALCAAGALIEPHLGLPVCVALAVWAPATRWTLLGAGAFLALVSLALLGPATNLEYVTAVLPAHALSEISRDTQYSLSAILVALGTPQGAAIGVGTAWYAAMLALGVGVAGWLARRTNNRAFFACIPPAFAVFGGTFIHATQIAAALPAAVLLVQYASPRYRTAAVVALLLLAVPWGWTISPAMLVAPLFPVAYLAWQYWNENLRATLLAGMAAAALMLALMSLAAAAPHVAHTLAPAIDPRLAEASWSAFTEGTSRHGLAAWLARIPTWSGLLLLLALLTIEARDVLVEKRCGLTYASRQSA